jgi:hypothetical protein
MEDKLLKGFCVFGVNFCRLTLALSGCGCRIAGKKVAGVNDFPVVSDVRDLISDKLIGIGNNLLEEEANLSELWLRLKKHI